MSVDGTDSNPSLEEQVKILQEQLAETQKLAAMGELVSTTNSRIQ